MFSLIIKYLDYLLYFVKINLHLGTILDINIICFYLLISNLKENSSNRVIIRVE